MVCDLCGVMFMGDVHVRDPASKLVETRLQSFNTGFIPERFSMSRAQVGILAFIFHLEAIWFIDLFKGTFNFAQPTREIG